MPKASRPPVRVSSSCSSARTLDVELPVADGQRAVAVVARVLRDHAGVVRVGGDRRHRSAALAAQTRSSLEPWRARRRRCRRWSSETTKLRRMRDPTSGPSGNPGGSSRTAITGFGSVYIADLRVSVEPPSLTSAPGMPAPPERPTTRSSPSNGSAAAPLGVMLMPVVDRVSSTAVNACPAMVIGKPPERSDVLQRKNVAAVRRRERVSR